MRVAVKKNGFFCILVVAACGEARLAVGCAAGVELVV